MASFLGSYAFPLEIKCKIKPLLMLIAVKSFPRDRHSKIHTAWTEKGIAFVGYLEAGWVAGMCLLALQQLFPLFAKLTSRAHRVGEVLLQCLVATSDCSMFWELKGNDPAVVLTFPLVSAPSRAEHTGMDQWSSAPSYHSPLLRSPGVLILGWFSCWKAGKLYFWLIDEKC